ncbi:hypothetical protein SVIOM342S_03339 [Streptomyces violaceorubidus]
MSWAMRCRSSSRAWRATIARSRTDSGVVPPQGVQQGVPLGTVSGGETGHHREHQERPPGKCDGHQHRQSEVFIWCAGHAGDKVEHETSRERGQCPRRALDAAAGGPSGADQQDERTEKGARQG